MFIVSPKGNYVPLANVDIISPVKDKGSRVLLKSGKSFLDPRTPAEIFADADFPQSTSVVIESFYKQVEILQKTVESTVKSTLQDVILEVTNANAKVIHKANKVSAAMDIMGKEVVTAAATVGHKATQLDNVIDTLDAQRNSLAKSTVEVNNVVSRLVVAVEGEI